MNSNAHPTTTLDQLPVKAVATIRCIRGESPDHQPLRRRLMELGFVPGEKVQILRRMLAGRGPMAVRVGTTCRFCERTDCSMRSAPSYKFAFRVDEHMKKDNFFSPLVSGDATVPVARLSAKKGR